FSFLSLLFNNVVADFCWILLSVYTLLVFIDSLIKNKNLPVALFSVIAVFTQLTGYGVGFIKEGVKELMSSKPNNQ
ncbi:MAG TPA: hypothetical protein VNW99_00790, partial [Cytophagaceae bacterium]|nr:hypothetical protein [Cytophagaceae bacterium]